jgi:2-polyprenyl-3-methyl-5-hydroxy-6-metoxy-1,4-benzoquinol methylase
MNKKCLVCSGEFEVSSRYDGLLACKSCGFITANVELEQGEFEKLYGHDYFHGDEYADYINEKEVIQNNFKKRLNDILNLPGVSNSNKLFEIGCAYGYFLDIARNSFAEVAGIDISHDATKYACSTVGVKAFCGDFIETDLPFRPDLICMWDVIEHMEKPDLAIRKASELLPENGYICITTGDIGSLVARARGQKWRMIHPPTHLHYFNKITLSKLLKRYGLVEVNVMYPPVIRTLRTILYGVLKLRWKLHKTHKLISCIPGQDIAIPINLFDIMFFVAKKETQ